jgi:hypothetical protein
MTSVRSKAVLLAALALLSVAAAAPAASPRPAPQVEQILIEVMVAKAGVLVGSPSAVAKVGSEGKLTWSPQPDPDGPGPQDLWFKTTARPGAHFAVQVAVSVDDEVVARREVVIGKTDGSELNFEAGGYTWNLRINYLSPALVQARRLRPK